MSKKTKIGFIVALASISIVVLLLFPFQSEAKERSKNIPLMETEIEDSTITLIAVGDIMMGTNYPSESYLPSKGTYLLKPLIEILRNADITFGNLEGTLLNSGGTVKVCQDSTKCYAFRQPEYFVDQLKDAGFDLFSVANNHMGDFGSYGRENTCKVLRNNELKFAGLEICPWDTMTVKGIKVGFTAFAPNTACLQITSYDTLKSVVSRLNDICDIVIVSFHGGAEGSSRTHVTRQTEIFYEENRGNVYEFARIAIDAGADVVLGHGPHVTRAIDYYKGRFITYSMGNFCTYGRFNLSGVSGLAPVYKLKLHKDGTFIEGEIISTKQTGEGGPFLDSGLGAFNQIKKLTAIDFPELRVTYDKTGKFHFN